MGVKGRGVYTSWRGGDNMGAAGRDGTKVFVV